jgi:transcriptional regulator with XRE-family HTH domain
MISGYLAGKKMPGWENLYKIAQLTGVSIEWLMSGRGPKYDDGTARQETNGLRIERRDNPKRKLASYKASTGKEQPTAVRKLLNLLENNPEMEAVIEAYIDGLSAKTKLPQRALNRINRIRKKR